MSNRREFITLLGGAAAAWPLAAHAQQAESSPKIGLLWPGDAPPASPRMESFRQGLRALGLVDGQNVAVEVRYAQRGPPTASRACRRADPFESRRHFCIRRSRAQSGPASNGDDPYCRDQR